MGKYLCPLCKNNSNEFFKDKLREFLNCSVCNAIFVPNQYLPDKALEISRYKEHNNDVNNSGYQKFVKPIVDEISASFKPFHNGLDFGAGTGPVISKLLEEKNYRIKLYDPFFHNFPDLLNETYDYIACCEVIEHFHKPAKEFQLLKNILAKNGKLYCMTSIYNRNIDFKNWYYKNDQTHVFFYQQETLDYILKRFAFSGLEVRNNLIIFSN